MSTLVYRITYVHANSLATNCVPPGLYLDWSPLVSCRLHGIYPVQNIEAMRQNMQYMKLVAYFKKIEEDFFNSCRSKVRVYCLCSLVWTHVQYNLKNKYNSVVLLSISSFRSS